MTSAEEDRSHTSVHAARSMSKVTLTKPPRSASVSRCTRSSRALRVCLKKTPRSTLERSQYNPRPSMIFRRRQSRRLLHTQRMHVRLQRSSGRVRPDSAHSAHDTTLSDANASRSQDLAPSQKRACPTVPFVSAEAVARRLEFVVHARAHVLRPCIPPVGMKITRGFFL